MRPALPGRPRAAHAKYRLHVLLYAGPPPVPRAVRRGPMTPSRRPQYRLGSRTTKQRRARPLPAVFLRANEPPAAGRRRAGAPGRGRGENQHARLDLPRAPSQPPALFATRCHAPQQWPQQWASPLPGPGPACCPGGPWAVAARGMRGMLIVKYCRAVCCRPAPEPGCSVYNPHNRDMHSGCPCKDCPRASAFNAPRRAAHACRTGAPACSSADVQRGVPGRGARRRARLNLVRTRCVPQLGPCTPHPTQTHPGIPAGFGVMSPADRSQTCSLRD